MPMLNWKKVQKIKLKNMFLGVDMYFAYLLFKALDNFGYASLKVTNLKLAHLDMLTIIKHNNEATFIFHHIAYFCHGVACSVAFKIVINVESGCNNFRIRFTNVIYIIRDLQEFLDYKYVSCLFHPQHVWDIILRVGKSEGQKVRKGVEKILTNGDAGGLGDSNKYVIAILGFISSEKLTRPCFV
ncbi:hypothetical protein ACJX0J_037371 [Zea mays]